MYDMPNKYWHERVNSIFIIFKEKLQTEVDTGLFSNFLLFYAIDSWKVLSKVDVLNRLKIHHFEEWHLKYNLKILCKIIFNISVGSKLFLSFNSLYNVHHISIYVFIIVFLDNNNLYEYLFDYFICSTVVFGCSLLLFMTWENSVRKWVWLNNMCLPYEFLILQYKLVFVGKISELLVILR
jgi:hypothetical protein